MPLEPSTDSPQELITTPFGYPYPSTTPADAIVLQDQLEWMNGVAYPSFQIPEPLESELALARGAMSTASIALETTIQLPSKREINDMLTEYFGKYHWLLPCLHQMKLLALIDSSNDNPSSPLLYSVCGLVASARTDADLQSRSASWLESAKRLIDDGMRSRVSV